MNKKLFIAVATAIYVGAGITWASATTTVVDNFTGTSASNPWVPLGDACLTAGNGTGSIPACGGTPATPGKGALMLTPNTNFQHGGIISPTPFNASSGITVTFNTYTYGGGGYNGGYGTLRYPNAYGISQQTVSMANSIQSDHGADGIGFYLIDANAPRVESTSTPGTLASTFSIGATGGSLGYQCSNTNSVSNGMPGGYLGLGIDEFGNFVNPGDNTNTGPGFAPNSIALRGYGDVNQDSIAAALGLPASSASTIPSWEVQQVCRNGGSLSGIHGGGEETPSSLPDYAYIPGSFAQLPKSQLIANTAAQSISQATPISYKLTITPSGLLSLEYSYNNGAYQQVLNNQPVSTGNAPLPTSLLFGFGASTGGATNYHEITCFQAEPANQSNSSSSVNVQQTGEVKTTTQVYLAYYSPSNWWGRLTAQLLVVDPTTGAITVNPVAQWDASCVLTGGICSSTGKTVTAQLWSSLPVLTWSGSGGVPFTWTGGITPTEQGWLNGAGAGSPPYGFGQQLLHYLKGDTTYDATSFTASTTTPSFRTRTSILGDIIDSSPVWVGGPNEGLPSTFTNALYPSATYAEDASGAQTYAQYVSTDLGRTNVVYVGANDGMLHGFQSGAYSSNGNYNSTTNNGDEVLAYVPYAVLQDFNKQVNTAKDYAYPGYGHNFYVDAPPGTGDVFYGGAWHTWLASGLGTGGRGLFALDITNPANFSTANAASLVAGDYTFANHNINPSGPTQPAGFIGTDVTDINTYQATMGDIAGKPIIRLMNDGDYAIISGNGQNSDDGEAGIYIMLVDPTTGAIRKTMFLGTQVGTTSAPDGVDYVSSAALNGNHFVDYLYAGDLQGNVWRVNVTSNNSANWHVSYYGHGSTPTPLFTTPTGQPITTQILVNSNIAPDGIPQIMLQFGTGQQTPLTNTSGATYAQTQQALYGIWDWGMGNWDALPGASQYAYASSSPSALNGTAYLAQQTITATGTTQNTTTAVPAETISDNPVCWASSRTNSATGLSARAGGSNCTANNEYGWYLNLPGSNPPASPSTTLYQQIIYNPSFTEGAAVFNTAIPPYVNARACATGLQSGFTMAVNPLTGGALQNGFFRSSGNNGAAITMTGGVIVSGLQLNATGSASTVTANGQPVMVQQTVNGNPVVTEVFPAGGMGRPVNWIQLR